MPRPTRDSLKYAGYSGSLDAFIVALSQAYDGGAGEGDMKGWFVSNRELQLASLDLCRACRSMPSLLVCIGAATPRRLWDPAGARRAAPQRLFANSTISSRVPALQVRSVRWMLCSSIPSHVAPVDQELRTGSRKQGVGGASGGAPASDSLAPGARRWSLLACLVRSTGRLLMSAGKRVMYSSRDGPVPDAAGLNGEVREVCWPASLRHVEFGADFNESIKGVVWATTLRRVTFGLRFNQAIDGVAWPAHLQELSFGDNFSRPITGVAWPACLQRLSFGKNFNAPIAGIVWPCGLRQLTFGDSFNQVIAGTAWPAALRQLWFGLRFNQPIAGVVWPVFLQQMSIGSAFNQPITAVAWPASLLNYRSGTTSTYPSPELSGHLP